MLTKNTSCEVENRKNGVVGSTFIGFHEAMNWWEALKDKNCFRIMGKKDRNILNDIMIEQINTLKY